MAGMAVVAKSLMVYFYAIEPFPITGMETFASGRYPIDEVLTFIKRLDPAAEEYRIRENLFGGETFCLVHDDGPQPILGAYYRDNLARPLTEYKGEINELMLREGEALVDAAYAAFFPNDVVGLVRTSSRAPGFAKIGQWLSVTTRYGCGLVALRDPNVLAQLDREPQKLRSLFVRIRRNRIPAIEPYSASVSKALRAAAEVNTHSDEIGLEFSVRAGKERAMWARLTRQEVEELLAVLPDFEKATVQVSGRKQPFNLLRANIRQSVQVPLIDKKLVGPQEAASALFKAYDDERNSIQLAVEALRGSIDDGPTSLD
jgi:hypothetical protein